MVDQNYIKRRIVGDSITYMSPRDFTSIVRPTMNEKIVEMKPVLLQLINSSQFSGFNRQDPHIHLFIFIELCCSVGIIGTDEETLFLRLFQFSLIGKSTTWLQLQPHQSLTSWKEVETMFLAHFFPSSKITEAKVAIATFVQHVDEPLSGACERFKALLRKCLNHGFETEK